MRHRDDIGIGGADFKIARHVLITITGNNGLVSIFVSFQDKGGVLFGYPLEGYLLASNVTSLPSGVYQYSPKGHNLTVVTQGKIDEYYNATASFEAWIKTAPAIFVITGDLSSMNQMPSIQMPRNQTSRNQTPGNQIVGRDLSRWVYIEAGAAAENLLLQVVSLDLASTYTAGFNANKTEELLGLPIGEVPIGVLPVGRKA